MIIKSLIIASIVLNSLGLSAKSNHFDRAVIRNQYNSDRIVEASINNSALPQLASRPEVKVGAPKADIYARNYILVDSDSGKILSKEAAHSRVAIASTTKIMTAIVVLENYKLGDVVTVSAKAASQPGATANFRVGEKLTVLNLLKTLLIKSANGAAYALAEHMNELDSAGSVKSSSTGPGGEISTVNNQYEEETVSANEVNSAIGDKSNINKFIDAMNTKANSLGLKDTEYHDPAGLDTTGYSSAYDLYLATKYALANDIFAQIVRTSEETIRNIDGSIWHPLKNSNRLVGEYKYPGAIGVKTGYMPNAGHVLVSAAKRDGHTLIGVVINTFADTAPASADESRKLLDWGWQNTVWQ